jgi:outer membrane protein assembly factor BamB
VAAVLALAALAPLAGCGGDAGVRSGATVNVYVSVPLTGPQAAAGRASCKGAGKAVADSGGRAGDLHIHVRCLDDSNGTAPWTLAAVGANARQAIQDTSTIAYVGELDPAASRFSRTVVESAEIAQLPATDGAAAMRTILHALPDSGTESPRNAVWEALER